YSRSLYFRFGFGGQCRTDQGPLPRLRLDRRVPKSPSRRAASIPKWCVGQLFLVGAALRGIGVHLRRFHHLNCAPGSLPPLWGKVRKGGSGRLQHCYTPPHPVLNPARREETIKRRAGEGLNLTPMPHKTAHSAT